MPATSVWVNIHISISHIPGSYSLVGGHPASGRLSFWSNNFVSVFFLWRTSSPHRSGVCFVQPTELPATSSLLRRSRVNYTRKFQLYRNQLCGHRWHTTTIGAHSTNNHYSRPTPSNLYLVSPANARPLPPPSHVPVLKVNLISECYTPTHSLNGNWKKKRKRKEIENKKKKYNMCSCGVIGCSRASISLGPVRKKLMNQWHRYRKDNIKLLCEFYRWE